MKLKIRPFDATTESEIRRIRGEILNGKFVLKLDTASYEIPTFEILEDQRGIFAVVEEGIIDLGFEYCIKIESEIDATEEKDGCSISFGKRHDLLKLKEELLKRGIDIDSVNMLGRTFQTFMTIYFNPSGTKNGTGFPVSMDKEISMLFSYTGTKQ